MCWRQGVDQQLGLLIWGWELGKVLYGVEDGVNLVRMTWEWVVFEAYVIFFK
jgi:hypothetical protein